MSILDIRKPTGLFPCTMCRQASIGIITIGFVAHGLCKEHFAVLQQKIKDLGV